jgi:hypothetical protein
MASAADLRVDRGQFFASRYGPSGLPDRLGERHEIIDAARRRVEFPVMPDEFPAPRRGQTAGVLLAQVIGVWFGVGRQRAHDGGGVRVDVRQRCDCQTWAAVARATPW